MKLSDIREQLNEQFKNKSLDSCYSCSGANAWGIGQVARNLLNKAGINRDQITLRDERNIICRVSYNNYTLFIITIKKAKGDSHYRYGTRWCDWTIKEVEISPYYFSEDKELSDVVAEIDNLVVEANKVKDQQKQEAISLIEYIMKAYDKKYYDACRMCDYISKNQYSLSDNFKN